MKTRWLVALNLGITLVALGCDDTGADRHWATEPQEASSPNGTQPLRALSEDDAVLALKLAHDGVVPYRSQGLTAFVDALQANLASQGIDAAAVLGALVPEMIGTPLPTVWAAAPARAGLTAGGSRRALLGPADVSPYADCPLDAPEDTGADPCQGLVKAVVDAVSTTILIDMDAARATLLQSYPTLPAPAQEYVLAWYAEALRFGVDAAAVYAQLQLSAAGKCDVHLKADQVAYQVGLQAGIDLLARGDIHAWARAQVTTCTVETDPIAANAKLQADARVDGVIAAHPMCAGRDLSNNNPALAAVTSNRRQGMFDGIAMQHTVLRAELFDLRTVTPCPDAGGGGGGGDPLVIDLDGDGLSMAAGAVSFDVLATGGPQSTAWVGPREAFLVLDRDGNGVVDSGAELFGNYMDCAGHNCFDGVEALARWDRASHGGNGDGLVDARDAVFARLRLWTDTNQDGVSQPGELATLPARGVVALGLDADRTLTRYARAAVSARLRVLTTEGYRTAHDVWFDLAVGVSDLKAWLPRQ